MVSFFRPDLPQRFRRAIIGVLVINLLTIGVLVHGHSLELHGPAHEPASTHAQVLCSLMCAAGHGVLTLLLDIQPELTPIRSANAWLVDQSCSAVLLRLVTRGPPTDQFPS